MLKSDEHLVMEIKKKGQLVAKTYDATSVLQAKKP